jgi:hypothetical protein
VVARGWEREYLVGAGDDVGELAVLLRLAFDHGFDDARVVGAQVDEAVPDASLTNALDSMWMRAWRPVAVTSQMASKKAKDAVYILQWRNQYSGSMSLRLLWMLTSL